MLHHAVSRFNPLDKRCGINLDEIDPAQWSLLEAATEDYIAASQDRFQQLANILATPAQASGQPACSAMPFRMSRGCLVFSDCTVASTAADRLVANAAHVVVAKTDVWSGFLGLLLCTANACSLLLES